jgi:hypothetical protein
MSALHAGFIKVFIEMISAKAFSREKQTQEGTRSQRTTTEVSVFINPQTYSGTLKLDRMQL